MRQKKKGFEFEREEVVERWQEKVKIREKKKQRKLRRNKDDFSDF